MVGKKIFNTQDLVLKVDAKSYDPIKFPLDDWDRFLDILCQNRDYQKTAVKTALHYLISPTLTTCCTKIPGVTMISGSSSPSSTT